MNMLWKILLHVVVGLIVGLIAAFVYSSVLPHAAAVVIGVVLGVLEMIAPAVSKHGISARTLFRVGVPFLVWPLVGLLLERGLHLPWLPGMVLASIAAACTGFSTHTHAKGHDSQNRIFESILALSIPLYALVTALVLGAGNAVMALACAGAGVACVVAYQSRTWPGRHEQAALFCACACVVAGLAWAALAGIAML